jgi:predicted transcriptional regulator
MKKKSLQGSANTSQRKGKTKNELPDFSQFLHGMNEKERAIVYALVEKPVGDTWDEVAERLGISRRMLYNYRQQKQIQDAVYSIAKTLLQTDTPDVFKALTAKAKAGDNVSMRLFFEVSGELRKAEEKDGAVENDELMRRAEKAISELNLNKDQLQDELVRRLRLSNS